jgi:O-antigen ligase
MKEKILFLLCTAFFCSLYISPMGSMPLVMDGATGALCVYCAYLAISGRTRGFAPRPVWSLWLPWLALYAWTILSAALSHDQAEGWSYVVLRLPLLAFPLSVGTLRISRDLRGRILLSYAVVTTLACAACLVYAFLQYRRTGDTGYLYDDSLTELSSVQSVYVALMVEIALFVFGARLVQSDGRGGGGANQAPARPWWIYACMAFLMVFQFMLASRIGLVLLYAIALGLGVWYFGVRGGRWGRVLVVAGVLAGCGLLCVALFPKTINRFRELGYTAYHYDSHGVESHYNMPVTADQWNGANVRLAVWKCTWTVCKDHLWTGVPVGDKRQVLVDSYRAVGFEFGARSRRNTHNTYLDVLLTYGVGGLLLFLAGFVVGPLWVLAKRRDLLGAIVVVLMLVSMVTETYIDRSVGCVLLGFFFAFFLSDYPGYTDPRPSPYPHNRRDSPDA